MAQLSSAFHYLSCFPAAANIFPLSPQWPHRRCSIGSCKNLQTHTHTTDSKVTYRARFTPIFRNLFWILKKKLFAPKLKIWVLTNPNDMHKKHSKSSMDRVKIDSDYKIAIFTSCSKFLLWLGEITHMTFTLLLGLLYQKYKHNCFIWKTMVPERKWDKGGYASPKFCILLS